MTKAVHYETPAEDRIPPLQKLIYGLGAFVNNLLSAAIGGMSIVLNLGLGMNPALVGLLGALPRLFDAFTDPLVGYISDHTNSRWGPTQTLYLYRRHSHRHHLYPVVATSCG